MLEAAHSGRSPERIIAAQRQALHRFEAAIEHCLAQGMQEDAAALAVMAGLLTTQAHPGVHASPRLEEALYEISRAYVTAATPGSPPPGSPPPGRDRVLIVVTETYPIGAHTRMLWRWVARDPARIYSVATTCQRGMLPAGAHAAISASGGRVVDLPVTEGVIRRASALRALAADADLIVILDHPHDPIATLAFAAMDERPPIVMMNHGDHLFWIGRRIVDALMCSREAGALIAARRGIPTSRILRTTVPVSGPDDHGRAASDAITQEARAAARARVLAERGWPPDTTLIVTVGSDYKYAGAPGLELLDLVEPVLAEHPDACLLGAGPEDTGRWRESRACTGGRIVALGPLGEGVGLLHDAADIYLESRPFGGPGAAMEAAAHGLPVLGCATTPLERQLFVTDEAYGMVCADGVERFREVLGQLIASSDRRADYGARARARVAATDDEWPASLERSYALARELGPVTLSELGPIPEPDELDVLIDFSNPPGRRLEADWISALIDLVELIVRSPAIRQLYASLDRPVPVQLVRFPVAFAAPGSDPAVLRSIVAELRELHRFRIAERLQIALAPDGVDEATAVLESALAAGPDFDLELSIDPHPLRLRPANSLLVVAGGEPVGDLLTHACAVAAVH